MSLDEARIEQYFRTRSSAIDIGAGDPSIIAARAASRRRRRRSAGSGVLALALVAGAVTVQQRGDDGGRQVTADVAVAGAADPLEWTKVVPQSGLGWSTAPVVGANGTLFGLSTAPGRHASDDPAALRSTLYRSTDGVEWTALALPHDLYPSRLAMSGDQLYAVGTAPAGGGGRDLVLAAGGTDGSQWSRVRLPLDLAALEARHGDDVSVSSLSVAAGPEGVVASVNVNVWVDAEQYVPAGTDLSAGWRWTAEGLEVFAPTERCEASRAGVREPCAKPVEPREMPAVASTFTWQELGISAELRSLIAGELHVFASADGTAFDEVSLPQDAAGQSTLVATDDGFVLFAQTWQDGSNGTVKAMLSPDGITWTIDPSASFTGYLDAAGRVDGRAAVVVSTYGEALSSVAYVQRTDGSWSMLDLAAAVQTQPGTRVTGVVPAVGPLGVAAVVIVDEVSLDARTGDVVSPSRLFVVHTPNGTDVSTVDVTELVGGGYVATMRVTADAVFAGFSTPKTDAGAEPSMRLLVGTPSAPR